MVTETLIELFKIDMETSKDIPQGNASLEGAEFTWKYYDGYYNKDNLPDKPTRTWTTKTIAEKDGDGAIHYVTRLADKYKVTGDSFYTQNGKNCLPLGTIAVSETKSPTGYLLEGAYMQASGSTEQITGVYVAQITEDGELAVLSGSNQHSVSDKVIRGGVKIQKRDLETKDTKPQGGATLKDTAFTITSLNENPVLVDGKLYNKNEVVKTIHTGIDGIASTASDWASHKHNTNAGKTSEDGVWFGTSEPDDSKGALLYDTYEIEELRCESNKGFKLIPAFEIIVSRNKTVIDLGTLTDEYEKEITIHTTATDKATGGKSIITGKNVTIVDTVKLDGLEKGRKYQLKGWQMIKDENAELVIDGKRVENDYTFTADSEEMKVEIEYTFNASELAGKNLVTFEELYDLSNPKEPVKVAEHKDIEDDGQTVLITEHIINIHTTATSKDGEKVIEADKDVTIVDTVKLDGLEVGTKYQLVGWQMIKDENAELIIDGQRVENEYSFTADSEAMEVQIAFTFDASELGGKDLVTFEKLYDLSNPDEPKKVTEHKDTTDKGQTVSVKEKPETPTPKEPEKPSNPQTPDTPVQKTDSPKTGDTTNVIALLALLGGSGIALAGTYFFKKRKPKKS